MSFLKSPPSLIVSLGFVALLLSGCSGPGATLDDASWQMSRDTIQAPYRGGVPHTDAQGRPRVAFDPDHSFLPIGIYHGLSGRYGGIDYSFAPLAAAGFNTVVAWGDVPTNVVLEAAEQHGLQVIISLPRDDEVLLARDHAQVLGFDIDHEPSVAEPLSEVLARLERFEARRADIRAIDPNRVVFTVDYPSAPAARLDGWETWRRAGDVTSFWNYPIAGDQSPSIGGPFGVGETISQAVGAVDAHKPIWFVAQAFEGPVFRFDWRMPDPAQARAMAYAAMIHGATGLIWFSYDSFVTRNGAVIGISPTPRPDYDLVLDHALTVDEPLRASARQIEASRELWGAVTTFNAEFAAQRELWLSPTAALDYQVEHRGARTSQAPVRTQLKQTREGLYLVAVNVDGDPVDFRVEFETPVTGILRVAGDEAIQIRDGMITGTLPGFGSFVLKLTLTDR